MDDDILYENRYFNSPASTGLAAICQLWVKNLIATLVKLHYIKVEGLAAGQKFWWPSIK
jgi:hypothetical protein